jgi:small subunit ribosomal protein S8
MVNDTISDMLTRIRNANLASKNCVAIPKTKIHINIAKILEQEGFIESFSMPSVEDTEFILNLKYVPEMGNGNAKKPCITNLKRISTPGLRIYTNYREIPQSFGGMGIVIISTSKGLMTDRDARKAKLGGEILCSVW